MKAHIARNLHAHTPTVLCWGLTGGDHGKLDGMASALRMRVVPVGPEDTGKTVAELLGDAPASKAPAVDMRGCLATVLAANFSKRELDTLLNWMKQAEVHAPLKAVATETNRTWPFAELAKHLMQEHAALAAQQAAPKG